jgi:hypothetical protein
MRRASRAVRRTKEEKRKEEEVKRENGGPKVMKFTADVRPPGPPSSLFSS